MSETCVLVSVLKITTPLLITSTNAVFQLLSRLELRILMSLISAFMPSYLIPKANVMQQHKFFYQDISAVMSLLCIVSCILMYELWVWLCIMRGVVYFDQSCSFLGQFKSDSRKKVFLCIDTNVIKFFITMAHNSMKIVSHNLVFNELNRTVCPIPAACVHRLYAFPSMKHVLCMALHII